MSAANVLRDAARLLKTEQVTWGTEWFIDPISGCRCAQGAIAKAADPDDVDGDPRFVRGDVARADARAAVAALADYLMTQLGVPAAGRRRDVFELDVVETVGGWNDEQDGPGPVIAALEAAAERATRRTAVAS